MVVTRMVNWTLDNEGHGFGDERERLRWYEGIVGAAGFQAILVPWTAAVLVWVVGERSVAACLAVVLAAFYVPMGLAQWYVARRKVSVFLVRWTVKSVVLGQLQLVPYMAFVFGAAHAYGQIDIATAVRVSVFQYVVLIVSGFATHWLLRRRRRREAVAADVD
jgi:hypothetical protein